MIVPVALLAVLFILTAVLVAGLIRELVLTRADVDALQRLILRPPELSYHQEPVPERLSALIPDSFAAEASRAAVVFVAPTCPACDDVLDELASTPFALRDAMFVVVIRSSQYPEFVDRCGQRFAYVWHDSDGELAKACEVRGTPTMLVLETPGLLVLDWTTGGDAQWVQSMLQAGGATSTRR